MSLPNKKIALLREYVGFLCEECRRHESKCGKLQVHRMRRGNQGGTYQLRNIKLLCPDCHHIYHAGEWN